MSTWFCINHGAIMRTTPSLWFEVGVGDPPASALQGSDPEGGSSGELQRGAPPPGFCCAIHLQVSLLNTVGFEFFS